MYGQPIHLTHELILCIPIVSRFALLKIRIFNLGLMTSLLELVIYSCGPFLEIWHEKYPGTDDYQDFK